MRLALLKLRADLLALLNTTALRGDTLESDNGRSLKGTRRRRREQGAADAALDGTALRPPSGGGAERKDGCHPRCPSRLNGGVRVLLREPLRLDRRGDPSEEAVIKALRVSTVRSNRRPYCVRKESREGGQLDLTRRRHARLRPGRSMSFTVTRSLSRTRQHDRGMGRRGWDAARHPHRR